MGKAIARPTATSSGRSTTDRRKAPPRQKRGQKAGIGPWRAVAFSVIVLVSLGAAVLLLGRVLFPDTPLPADGNVVDLKADMGGFSQSVIKAKVNEPVTVRLTSMDTEAHSDGGGVHQFAIDELKVNILAPPRGKKLATFTPEAPGTYEFYCDICCGGRANPTMVGKFVVEA